MTRSTGSLLVAHFMTIDTNGCIRNDLFIHGVAGSPGAIDADVQSYDLCSGSLLLLSGGTNYASSVQVDEALQAGTTTPAAPGLSPNFTGFHITTPYVNVTYNGVPSIRAATASGSIQIAGFNFPASSVQPDLTNVSAGSSNFMVAFKP